MYNKPYNAFIVIGPESSGTRVLTRMFVEAGCFGQDTNGQKLDLVLGGQDTFERVVGNSEKLVFRRSIPHSKTWPDINGIHLFFESKGFTPLWLITCRDWYSNIRSKIKRGHANKWEKAITAYKKEWEYLVANKSYFRGQYYYVNMSMLFEDPNAVLSAMAQITKVIIPVKGCELIFNPDKEYTEDKYNLVRKK